MRKSGCASTNTTTRDTHHTIRTWPHPAGPPHSRTPICPLFLASQVSPLPSTRHILSQATTFRVLDLPPAAHQTLYRVRSVCSAHGRRRRTRRATERWAWVRGQGQVGRRWVQACGARATPQTRSTSCRSRQLGRRLPYYCAVCTAARSGTCTQLSSASGPSSGSSCSPTGPPSWSSQTSRARSNSSE